MVCEEHNHEIITERRKKGSLKALRKVKHEPQNEDNDSDSNQAGNVFL